MHLRGAFHVVRPSFPVMCDAGYGRIVLTSSIGGLYGNHGVANYAVAKAGVIGLSNVAAMEGVSARGEEQCHRARRRHADGRGHRHVGVSADGTRIWWHPPSHGWRTRHVRSQARSSSRSRVGSPRRWWPKPRACTGRRGRSKTSARTSTRSATTPNRWCFPWCQTGTAITSATASEWLCATPRRQPCVAAR